MKRKAKGGSKQSKDKESKICERQKSSTEEQRKVKEIK